VIVLRENTCTDLSQALRREWLETNGLGGYASSTIICCHTRKYHGLLVANLDEPGGRFVLLSKCEDSIVIDAREYFLTIHKYPLTYHPENKNYLNEYSQEIAPHFTFHIGNTVLHKELMLLPEENTLLIRYHLKKADASLHLKVRPFLAYRNIHELAAENDSLGRETEIISRGVAISPYEGMPSLFMEVGGAYDYHPQPLWYRDFEYEEEQKRGFPCREDLFAPGHFGLVLSEGEEATFSFSTNEQKFDIGRLWKSESRRREDMEKVTAKQSLASMLEASARHYVIKNRKGKRSIVAGYHWFYEWGRDTLISLPGLTFHAGRIEEGIEILDHMGGLRKNGFIPNNISEADEAIAYNSVDASLWFFWCIQEFLKVTGNYSLVLERFWPALYDIVLAYYGGRTEQVSFLENGLLRVGTESTQLTWMDAKVNDIPVTPRHGCPIEINALWYNALCLTKELSQIFGIGIDKINLANLINEVTISLNKCFWISEKGYLADLWMPESGTRDESMRPNQIFAVSLPYCTLNLEKKALVVKRVTEELLTPYGLRTLSRTDRGYQGHYGGFPEERDGAYHQGTVWPWLLGHYGEALLKVSGDPSQVRLTLKPILDSLFDHLSDAGIGHISEIFSGDYPHQPDGCIAQAWSVAEVLRLCALLEIDR
jgi:predicted glycogen debranching enzyme